jgi:hypothetical protein
VCDDEGDRPRSVREIGRQLDVATPLTQAAGHTVCLDLGRCAEELSKLLHGPVVRLLRLWNPRVFFLSGFMLKPRSHDTLWISPLSISQWNLNDIPVLNPLDGM